jgi:hypothetical protein
MATTRRKAALATTTTRAREEITADEGLRVRLDMRASFLPYTDRHSGIWPWYIISDAIIQTRQSMYATAATPADRTALDAASPASNLDTGPTSLDQEAAT